MTLEQYFAGVRWSIESSVPGWVTLSVYYVLFALGTAFTLWLFRESIRQVHAHDGASGSATAALERMLCVLADIRRMLVVRTVRRVPARTK
jgi:hypothetical protein